MPQHGIFSAGNVEKCKSKKSFRLASPKLLTYGQFQTYTMGIFASKEGTDTIYFVPVPFHLGFCPIFYSAILSDFILYSGILSHRDVSVILGQIVTTSDVGDKDALNSVDSRNVWEVGRLCPFRFLYF